MSIMIQRAVARVDALPLLVGSSFLAAVLRGTGFVTRLDALLTAVQFGTLVLALILLWLSSRGQRRIGLVHGLAAAFSIVALLSAIWSPVPATTLTRAALFCVILAIAFETARIRWTDLQRMQRDLRLLFWAVVAVSTAGLILGLFQFPGMWGPYNRFEGLNVNATVGAWMATMLFPIGYSVALTAGGRRRFLLLAGSGILVVVVILSGTRGALIALLLSVIVVHSLTRKRWLIGAIVGLIVAAGLAFTFLAPEILSVDAPAPAASPIADPIPVPTPSTPEPVAESPDPQPTQTPAVGRQGEDGTDISSGRFGLWKNGLEFIQQRPIGGWGFGSTSDLPGFTGGQSMSLHNAYLSTLIETGILGALFLGALCVVIFFRRSVLKWPGLLAAGGAVLINGLFESSLVNLGSPVTIVSWLVIGALYAAGRSVASSEDEIRNNRTSDYIDLATATKV